MAQSTFWRLLVMFWCFSLMRTVGEYGLKTTYKSEHTLHYVYKNSNLCWLCVRVAVFRMSIETYFLKNTVLVVFFFFPFTEAAVLNKLRNFRPCFSRGVFECRFVIPPSPWINSSKREGWYLLLFWHHFSILCIPTLASPWVMLWLRETEAQAINTWLITQWNSSEYFILFCTAVFLVPAGLNYWQKYLPVVHSSEEMYPNLIFLWWHNS